MSAEHAWLPLTQAQLGLYFAQVSQPDSPAWTTAEVVEIEGEIDPSRLAEAVAAAHRDHEQLLTRFRATPQGPEQQVDPGRVHPFSVLDVSDHADPTAAAAAWLQAELARPMDLAAGDVVRSGLLRLGPERSWWWHAAHHVVLDGYGAVQLLRRVAEHHVALCAGVAAPERPGTPLVAIVADDARVHAAETDAGADTFWENRLADATEVVALAGRVATPCPTHRRASIDVPEELQRRITAGAQRLGVSWADLIQVAVGTYVARCTDAHRTRIGVPLMNRSRAGDGQLAAAGGVCTAMNVLPATVLAGELPWGEALAAFAAEQQHLRQHPFRRQEALTRALTRGAAGQLFGAQVNLVPFALDLSFSPQTTGRVRNLTAGPVEDLTVCLRGVPGRGKAVRLEVDAHPELYSAEAVEAHLTRLLHWLAVCAEAAADTPVADLPLLPAAEWHQVVREFNDSDQPHTAETLSRRFERQRARTPQACAIIDADHSMTYAEVGEASDRLARALIMAGVQSGDVVGVMLPRSIDLWVALHAVQRVGAVHLPLDAEQPGERIAAMLGDAACDLVVVPDGLPGDLPGDLPGGVSAVALGSSAPDLTLPPVPEDPAAAAYLLFTSGSTGRPKGVLVHHAAIDNRLAWMQHQFPIGPGDRVLGKTPITFDVSVWEHFWPWQCGATVVVAGPEKHRDPRAIADLVVEHRVDVLHFVPSMLRAFLADRVSVERVRSARTAGRTVRHVVCSGEALTADLVSGCRDVFGVAPTNLYGPTEAAVDVTCQPTDDLDGALVPIGRPVWNTACYVLDGHDQPVPVGVPGHLWLGGVQVALGYVNRPELTAERFRADPFRPGGRRYDTGDLAQWTPDGTLLYLGRGDDQVKVRGQRVELGEVEAALAGVPGVDGVVAGMLGPDLVLWYRAVDDPASPRVAGTAADLSGALRAAAARVLPEGVRPSHFLQVAEIPVSVAGKADRRRLLEMTGDLAADPTRDGHVLAPDDLDEQRICELFAAVLGRAVVAADGDFFDLGGDSLKVLALLGEIEDAFGVTLEVRTVFATPTPTALARAVAERRAGAGGADDLAEVLTLRAGDPDVPPLVLLPPAGGLGWCYTSLVRHLPREQGVLTVQAPGLETGHPEPVANLTALAHRQLRAIRSVVGTGPFHVAGWSLGGMAAHEVAALARAQGQRVGRVIVLDAYPSEQWSHLSVPTEAEALVGILRLGGVEHLVDEATSSPRPLTREVAIEALRRGGSALAGLPEPVLHGAVASVVEAAGLVRSSTHHTLSGDLDVVVATAPRPEHWLDPTAWAAHTDGRIHAHHIPCSHGDLLRGDNATSVGTLLRTLLARGCQDAAPASVRG